MTHVPSEVDGRVRKFLLFFLKETQSVNFRVEQT